MKVKTQGLVCFLLLCWPSDNVQHDELQLWSLTSIPEGRTPRKQGKPASMHKVKLPESTIYYPWTAALDCSPLAIPLP